MKKFLLLVMPLLFALMLVIFSSSGLAKRDVLYPPPLEDINLYHYVCGVETELPEDPVKD